MLIKRVLAPLLTIILLSATPLAAHDWYPPECCSGQDCAPVSAVSFVASSPNELPVMVVTTEHGTKPVPRSLTPRESPDGRMHACIYQGNVICLFMPPTN
jgi:hypothetical protein